MTKKNLNLKEFYENCRDLSSIGRIEAKMIIHHKGLTVEHWSTFSLAEQMANVGCDIERALELLMLTKIDPRHKKGRRRELCRVYEALVDHFVYDNEYNTTDESWQNYFYQFNYAAALERQNRRKQGL